jgi:hypothetical protein
VSSTYPPVRCLTQWSRPGLVLGLSRPRRAQEGAAQLRRARCTMPRCSGVDPLLILCCRDRAVLDKKSCEFSTCPACTMRNAVDAHPTPLPRAVANTHRADKEPRNIDVSPVRRPMQWSRPVLSWAVATAPCSIRSRATSTCPPDDAQCNGVDPYLSWAVATAPHSIRSRATSTCPLDDARCSGVDPLLSWAVATAPCSIRSRATSACPLDDATCSGVDPLLSWAVATAPCSIRSRATSTCP